MARKRSITLDRRVQGKDRSVDNPLDSSQGDAAACLRLLPG